MKQAQTGKKPDYGIQDGLLAHYRGPGGTITLPDSLSSIGEDAFQGALEFFYTD